MLALYWLVVTEGASRNARMGKTRKEAIEIPKWDSKCHVLKFPVRKTKQIIILMLKWKSVCRHTDSTWVVATSVQQEICTYIATPS